MDSQQTPILKLVLADGPVDRNDALDDVLDEEVELGFHFDQLLALNPDIQVSQSLMAEHLAHAIAANPTNLLCHTQRVFFHYKNWDSDGLYSALLDLFIAVDDKAAKLRTRLLKGSQGHLAPEHFAILSRWLAHGPFVEEKDLLPAEQSILSRGITGTTKLVQVARDESETQRNPLQEAREHIEYFQIEEAREILEAAIMEQPEWEELHIELVHLYQATRDAAGLQAMREKLSQIMPELPHCWRPLGGENP